MAAGAAYAAVLLGAYAVCAGVCGTDDEALDDDLREARIEIDAATHELEQLQGRLEEAKLKLEANRAVGEQPDWSVLLGALAKGLDDEIVLTRCHLKGPDERGRPGAGQAPEPTAAGAGPERFSLETSGFGRSQAGVAQFVLRLERTKLFRAVTLVKANREPFMADRAVAFLIECSL